MFANSEGGRIARLVEDSRRCSVQENLQRARAYQTSCLDCKSTNYLGNKDIPQSSTYLQSKTRCFNQMNTQIVPESVRIARLEQALLEVNALDPNMRFADYAPNPTVVPCPPITFLNGRPSTKCPLPNTPLNSALQ